MIIPPGYAHVQHFFGGASAPNGAAVTYGVSAIGFADPEACALQMHLTFATEVMPALSSPLQLQSTRAKFGPNATGPFGVHSEVVNGGGQTDVLPPNVALLVEKRTALGGRSGRGRLYLPGIGEDAVNNDGTLGTGMAAAWQTILDDWLAAIEAVATGMWVFHNASSDPTAVTSLQVDPVVATQRRRLRS